MMPFGVKQTVASLCWQFGLPQGRLRKFSEQGAYWIVNYHRVCPQADSGFSFPPYFDLRTSPELFDRHLEFYCQYFDICSLEELTHTTSETHQKPKLAITFDDGYADNYHYAFPLLQKYQCPALIYVATEGLYPEQLLWDNQIFYSLEQLGVAPLREYFGLSLQQEFSLEPNEFARQLFQALTTKIQSQSERVSMIGQMAVDSNTFCPPEIVQEFYLQPEHLGEMSQAGITFGSHTQSHAFLSACTIEEVYQELEESKEDLESILQKPIDHFCYPSGMYDAQVKEAVHQTGYHTATTTQPGANTSSTFQLELCRYGVSKQKPSYLAFEISGLKESFKEVFR